MLAGRSAPAPAATAAVETVTEEPKEDDASVEATQSAGEAAEPEAEARLDLEEAPAPEEAAVSPPADVDLGTVESVWPALVAQIRDQAGPRRHAWLRESVPVEVAEGRVVLEVPAHLPFHLEQLKADHQLVEMVGNVASELMGGRVEVVFKAGAAETADAEPVRAPDKEDLVESSDEGAPDPAALVVEGLGGEIVSE